LGAENPAAENRKNRLELLEDLLPSGALSHAEPLVKPWLYGTTLARATQQLRCRLRATSQA
jgi:hypothetical protein